MSKLLIKFWQAIVTVHWDTSHMYQTFLHIAHSTSNQQTFNVCSLIFDKLLQAGVSYLLCLGAVKDSPLKTTCIRPKKLSYV